MLLLQGFSKISNVLSFFLFLVSLLFYFASSEKLSIFLSRGLTIKNPNWLDSVVDEEKCAVE